MGSAIIQKMDDGIHGGFGTIGLLGGESADGDKDHGEIDSAVVVEESAENFLYSGEFSSI